MPFKKGDPGLGRPKGVKNKFGVSMKNMVLEVFEKRGGVEAMLEWSNEHPSDFYKLCAKMIPQAVEVEGGDTPIKFVIVTGVPDSEALPKPITDRLTPTDQ